MPRRTEDQDLLAIREGLVAAIESVAGSRGLHLSRKIISPDADPATLLDGAYSIRLTLRNSKLIRDKRDRRIMMVAEAEVNTAHWVNPQDEPATQALAEQDCQNAIIRVCSTTDAPLCYCQIEFLDMDDELAASREWLFHRLLFELHFTLSLDNEEVAR